MELRRIAILGIVCGLIAVFATPASAASRGSMSVKDPGFEPLSDALGAADKQRAGQPAPPERGSAAGLPPAE